MTTDTKTFRAGTLTGEEDEENYEVLARLAKSAGKGALTPLVLRSWATLNRVWVAEQDEKFLGFLLTCPLSTLELWQWNQKLGEEEQILVSGPCLHLVDLVIEKNSRNCGIGSELVRGILEHEKYDNQGGKYPLAVATSRIPSSENTKGTSFHVLLSNNFIEVGTIKGFYRDSEEWTCRDCSDKGACDCLGVMMMYKREEAE